MIPNLFFDGFRNVHTDIVERQVQEALKIEGRSLVAFLNAMRLRPDRLPVLKGLARPVQLIIGKNDNIIPFNNILQQTHASNSNFVSLYDNCGHMSMFENPAMLILDLEEFISYCFQLEK